MQFSKQDLISIFEKSSTINERLSKKFLLNDIQENNALVSSRLELWCQVSAQGNWKQFENRLAYDGLDLSKVRQILAPVSMRNTQHLPTWSEILNECVKKSGLVAIDILDSLDKDIYEKNIFLNPQQTLTFEEVFIPFIYVARERLIDRVDSDYQLLSDKAHACCERSLLGWLSHLCSPSIEFEFSVFRATRQSTINRLSTTSINNSSKLHYNNFIKHFIEEGVLAFFKEYPVLARLVATVIDLWVNSTKEFICRLKSDLNDIQKTFQSTTELGKVVALQMNLSDRHNNGRSVMGLTFESGLRLIYKPKNVDLEQTYVKLLTWLNKQSLPLPFKLFKVLNRSNYGWIEFVDNLPCKNKEEARRYYRRAGMLLCLTYVLEGTDLHYENIIACGEYPVLIDLETLMHPRVREMQKCKTTNSAKFLAHYRIWHSVFRTGLLPRWEFGSGNQAYDVSGLGGVGQQETSFRVPKLRYINTDNMLLDYEYKKTKERLYSPSLNGANLLLNDYLQEIIEGFQGLYHFLMDKRQAILASSPFVALKHQSIRFVFRTTSDYNLILKTGLQPKYLRNGVERSIQLDLLCRAIPLSDKRPSYWWLVHIEKESLEQMDIPLFSARSDSKDLTIRPNQSIKNLFTEPSFNLVVSKLKQLNNEDLTQQISFINCSLYSRTSIKNHNFFQSDNFKVALKTAKSSSQEEMVQQVVQIATTIKQQAIISDEGSAIWIAPEYILDAQRFQLQPMGYKLYDGICGVVLFMGTLEKVLGNSEFRSLTLGALQYLRQELRELASDSSSNSNKVNLGAAVGLGSIIYALVHISQLLKEPALLDDAKQVTSMIKQHLIFTDTRLDIISGAAGAILCLLQLYKIFPDSEVIEKAITCGNHLLNNRVVSESGYRTWATLDRKLLTGFSHGAAGMTYALLRLYKATGETRFKEAAEEAIAYERSVFIPELNNWPDFRQPQTKDNPKCMCSWCHGAPGIGLARVATLDILDTPEIRQDIEAAITTTLNYGLSDIDHLCCGNMGRVEFLFTAGRKLNRPELVDAAMKLASQVVARAEQKGHYGYGPILDFHPGFFQGASGIGYQLLRLAYPDQLPSVLLWE